MAFRIRFEYPSDNHLSYAVERLSDGAYLDFADGTFKANPGLMFEPLPEAKEPFRGLYSITKADAKVSQWADGDYSVVVIDQARLNANESAVVGSLVATMQDGDDLTPPRPVKVFTVVVNGLSIDVLGRPTPEPARS